ncbi:MAG: LytR/AlgR family response regulator transcription factor [Bacteroidota bacterium]
MKVLIIEDEAPAFRRLEKVLEEVEPGVEIIDVIDSVEESVKWFDNHQHPDLIFMDIQLSDGISFEIFEKTRITKPVIFTTAFDEYMLRAFKVNSIDYLLKPIIKEDLRHSLVKYKDLKSQFSGQPDLERLVKQIQLTEKQFKSRFLVKVGEKLISVVTEDIAYFYTKNGVVYLVTNRNNRYLMDQVLEEISNDLDPKLFYRLNRQFLVQFKHVESVNRFAKGKLLIELNPGPGEQVIVSAEKAADFRSWLDQ